MAGIGFELRRVIAKGGLARTLGAAFAGVFVVAGPWLLTILSMSLIGRSFAGSGRAYAPQFQAAVIYAYGGSLALFSALHYLFTRLVADLVWEGRQGEASTWTLRFALLAALASALVGAAFIGLVPLDPGLGPGLYRGAFVVLFVSVNVMWIVMLFASLLRRHLLILAIFAAGLALAIGLVDRLGSLFGAGGAVLGYALGHLLIAAGLLTLGLRRHPPLPAKDGLPFVLAFARKNAALILSGAFFYLGQWADKFWFWWGRGEAVAGTGLRLYPAYDIQVYIAGLSIIPGLVWFVVFSETEISSALRRFLGALGHETLGRIRESKRELAGDLRRELRDQSLLQLGFSLLVVWLVLPSRQPGMEAATFVAATGGAFALFTYMTLINFLYYFGLNREALASSLVFLGLNGLVFPPLQLAFPLIPPGTGYLLAALLAALYCFRVLIGAIPELDHLLFLKSLRKEY